MSKAFNEFHFALIGNESWIGLEALFQESEIANYTVKAQTAIKVLEIGLKDVQEVINPSLSKHLESLSMQRHMFIMRRIQQICQMSSSVYEQRVYHSLHKRSVEVMLKLYPQASTKILRSAAISHVLDGKIKSVRTNDSNVKIYT
jgi:hypothetical protein